MCSQQDWRSAHQLLDGDVDDVNAQDETGTTPLIHAVYYGRDSLVERLLDAGAAPNMVGLYGMCAVHSALCGFGTWGCSRVGAQCRIIGLLQLLLNYGAGINRLCGRVDISEDGTGTHLAAPSVLGLAAQHGLPLLRFAHPPERACRHPLAPAGYASRQRQRSR